jgi:hypothetical protein
MPPSSLRWSEIWRVLAYTLAIALSFVALGRLQVAVIDTPTAQDALQRLGLLDADPTARWAKETKQVAEASRAAISRAPPGHRLATVRLGFELGFASGLVGAYAMSSDEARARARQAAQPHVALAEGLAAHLGVGEARALDADSLKAFTELGQRYEADENNLAGRIEQRLSPLHRHLYLLGTQLGGEAARIEDTGGAMSLPPASRIGRHATVAGIDPRLWRPLAAEPKGETPPQVLQRYRGALQALADELARQDAADAPAASR